ncbi:MAG: MoxR family ATPase [Clostridia bacterium]|nr:MoxR family ATPase [Clostridia bacterium]
MKLNRPLLIEGAAGVGKTEVAKAAARAFGRELVRLQCYEGLDESKALYEWNYQKQLLAIQMDKGVGAAKVEDLFGEEYLLERPLLKSIRSKEPVVLLIDEIDKADAEFEAFLLELLSEMQVTIPEYGTVRARSVPFIVLTSNHTRPLSEALRRRCAYLYLEYPDVRREIAILRAKLPGLNEALAAQVARAAAYLRQSDAVTKKPSVAESLDWAEALMALGAEELDEDSAAQTLGFALKNNDDIREIVNDADFIRSIL